MECVLGTSIEVMCKHQIATYEVITHKDNVCNLQEIKQPAIQGERSLSEVLGFALREMTDAHSRRSRKMLYIQLPRISVPHVLLPGNVLVTILEKQNEKIFMGKGEKGATS